MIEWKARLRNADPPLYLALAEALLDDIVSGKLPPGSRLPNQRDLADTLEVSVGTVTRAYQVAESRGAIDSTPGRGSFVKDRSWPGSSLGSSTSLDGSLTDLSMAHPLYTEDPDLAAMLLDVAQSIDVQRYLRYQALADDPRYRAVGEEWLRACGVGAKNHATVFTSGAQHACLVLTLALTDPGDSMVADELTYPGILSIAEQTGRRVQGIPMDRDGMIPDALDEACQEGSPKVLYLIPTLHNPTGILMPEVRRLELSRVAEKHGLFVVEDDTLRLLAPDPPPSVTSMIPDRAFFVGSLSKTLAGGLRLAFLSTPRPMAEAVRTAIGATVFMPSPLLMEVAARWIEDGTAEHTVARRRAEIGERQRVAREVFGAGVILSHPQSYYAWLHLGSEWEGAEFEAEARRRGVGVIQSRPFSVDASNPPAAVRICLSAAESIGRLEEALRILAHLRSHPEGRASGIL